MLFQARATLPRGRRRVRCARRRRSSSCAPRRLATPEHCTRRRRWRRSETPVNRGNTPPRACARPARTRPSPRASATSRAPAQMYRDARAAALYAESAFGAATEGERGPRRPRSRSWAAVRFAMSHDEARDTSMSVVVPRKARKPGKTPARNRKRAEPTERRPRRRAGTRRRRARGARGGAGWRRWPRWRRAPRVRAPADMTRARRGVLGGVRGARGPRGRVRNGAGGRKGRGGGRRAFSMTSTTSRAPKGSGRFFCYT